MKNRRRRTVLMWPGVPMLLVCGQAFAGSPYVTDDPEPVETGHYEFYVASQETKTASGRSGSLPHLELNYGLMEDVQVHLLVPVNFSQPASGSTQYGVGDAEIGFKYRFIQETESQPMVGVYPILVSASGNASKNLGNGGTQLYLPVWLQKRWGDWQSNAGVGYRINHAPTAQNSWFAGWQLQRDLSEHLTVGGELFHLTQQQLGQGASTGFNLGVTVNLNQHDHLLFSAGRALINADRTNQFSSYLAYLRTW